MDMQTAFNAVIGALMMLSGWFLRIVWDSIKRLQQDQATLERHVNETYVRRDDYRDDMAEMKLMLRQIISKLDEKQDK
jgi:hypothetical protein